ncbi:MAG: hypothetical protein Q8N09_05155 [Thermodesulfovibrionia bacterium]|nr:hypothetical protein [Thermodesulfovibrionia bacterium]
MTRIHKQVITILNFSLMIILLETVCARAEKSIPTGYSLKEKYVLTESVNSVDGDLEIYASRDGHKAFIQIVSKSRTVITSEPLDYPSIRPAKEIQESPMWFEYSVDRSIGFGSYNGIETQFFKVVNANIEWVTAINEATQEELLIHLMKSLKTDWKIVNPSSPQILKVACRPDLDEKNDNLKFKVIYTRYFKRGLKWIMAQREEEGFMEFGSGSKFPEESKFPY